jgi:hypothetical protein
MTLSADAKWGKSWFAMQLGLALASGECEFLDWKLEEPRRVLYLQIELPDSMVRERLEMLLDKMPEGMSPERARLNFLVHTVSEGRPNLMDETGRQVLQALLDRWEPDVLIVDPLAFAFPGLNENSADSMGEALRFLTDLATDNNMAVVLLHHQSKNKGEEEARGSSVFFGWPESDLLVRRKEPEPGVAEVSLRLRCAPNDGPLYWRRPTEDDPWFAAMPEDWKPPQGGEGNGRRGKGTFRQEREKKQSVLTAQLVARICAGMGGPVGRTQLIKAVCDWYREHHNPKGVGDKAIRPLLKQAVAEGLLQQAKENAPYQAAPGVEPIPTTGLPPKRLGSPAKGSVEPPPVEEDLFGVEEHQ